MVWRLAKAPKKSPWYIIPTTNSNLICQWRWCGIHRHPTCGQIQRECIGYKGRNKRKRNLFGRPEVWIAVFVRKGGITTCTAKEKALQYTHFPPHNFSQVVRKEQHIDFGRGVHIRAHAGHFLEFKTHWTGDVLLENISVFIRVQAPKRVGGPYDHWSWSPHSVARDRPVKSLDVMTAMTLRQGDCYGRVKTYCNTNSIITDHPHLLYITFQSRSMIALTNI